MMTRMRRACGVRRRGGALGQFLLGIGLTAVLWGAGLPALAGRGGALLEASTWQPPRAAEHAAPASAEGHGAEVGLEAAEGHGAEEGGGLLSTIGKIVNSAILVGTLLYFLRAPVTQYLDDRMTQVRQDLVTAADTRTAASAQIEELERRLAGLPGEIDTLKGRGALELAAEEVRLRQATGAQRERLLEQTRRDIDLQARVAERDLRAHAADMAVRMAAERIRRTVTDRDQLRLIDRYVEQMTPGS